MLRGRPDLSRVLIVEDDEQVRMLAESILQDAGHQTCSAATRTEAKAILESGEPINLLFVDLSLPEDQEAGLQLAQAAAKRRPGLPVIYTTGRGITEGMLALFVERNAFLAKPYSSQQLLTAVTNVLK
jgi:DNA-binding NtrC family response regulator